MKQRLFFLILAMALFALGYLHYREHSWYWIVCLITGVIMLLAMLINPEE